MILSKFINLISRKFIQDSQLNVKKFEIPLIFNQTVTLQVDENNSDRH